MFSTLPGAFRLVDAGIDSSMTPIRFRHGILPLIALPGGLPLELAFSIAAGYDPGDVTAWEVVVSARYGDAAAWRSENAISVSRQSFTLAASMDDPSADDAAVTLADAVASGRCTLSITATAPGGAWRIQGPLDVVAQGAAPDAGAGIGDPVEVRLTDADTILVTILGNSASAGGTVDNAAVNDAIAEAPATTRAALGLGSAATLDTSDFDPAGTAAAEVGALQAILGTAATADAADFEPAGAVGALQATLGDAATLDVGTGAGTVAAGNDPRMSDSRTPTAHKASHAAGGADAITPADIGAATAAQGALAASALQAIPTSGVANSHLANMASGTLKGQTIGGSGDPVDLTPAQQKGIVEAALASGGPIAIRATGTNNNVVLEPNGNGAAQVKGNGAGMAAYALLEFVDGNGSRIGMIYNEPTSGKMVFMNSRAGTLSFGNDGADRFTVYNSGGIYIGNSPSDPGSNALLVQGAISSSTSINLAGASSGLPVKTGTGGALETGAFGAGAGQFAEGNHTHAQLHNAATVSGNGISISGQQISLSIGTGATQVAAGNHTHTLASLGIGSTDSPTFAGLTLSAGTLTASTPVSLTQTWNNAAVTFTGMRLNVTNTASSTSSMLLDLQTDGSSRFRISRSGSPQAAGTTAYECYSSFGGLRTWLVFDGGGGNPTMMFNQTGSIGFNNASDAGTGGVVMRYGGSVGTLQLGTLHATTPTAQTLQAHGVTTGTGASLTLQGGSGSVARGNVLLNGGNRSAYIASPTSEQIRDILISHGLMAAS